MNIWPEKGLKNNFLVLHLAVYVSCFHVNILKIMSGTFFLLENTWASTRNWASWNGRKNNICKERVYYVTRDLHNIWRIQNEKTVKYDSSVDDFGLDGCEMISCVLIFRCFFYNQKVRYIKTFLPFIKKSSAQLWYDVPSARSKYLAFLSALFAKLEITLIIF